MLQASVDAGPSTESATETSTAATDTSGGHGSSANLVSPAQSPSLSPDLEKTSTVCPDWRALVMVVANSCARWMMAFFLVKRLAL